MEWKDAIAKVRQLKGSRAIQTVKVWVKFIFHLFHLSFAKVLGGNNERGLFQVLFLPSQLYLVFSPILKYLF